MKRLPHAVEDTNNISLENSIIPADKVKEMLAKRYDVYRFYYDGSIVELNKLFKQLSVLSFPCDIELWLTIGNNLDIRKNTFLALDNIKSNVKLKVVNGVLEDTTGIKSWCINLSSKDYEIVAKHLLPDDRKYIDFEREAGKSFYAMMIKRYPNFNWFTSKKKMDICFDWVARNVKYDFSVLDSTGNIKIEIDRNLVAQPYYVLKNRAGVCSGRSELLKSLTNNPYVKLNCYTASGRKGSLGHEWNDFIDDDGIAYSYDLSYNIKYCMNIEQYGHIVERRAHEVIDTFTPSSTKKLIKH